MLASVNGKYDVFKALLVQIVQFWHHSSRRVLKKHSKELEEKRGIVEGVENAHN